MLLFGAYLMLQQHMSNSSKYLHTIDTIKLFFLDRTGLFLKHFYLAYCTISVQQSETSKRTVSIKRHCLNFFKKSLLNVQYDLKNQGLNT